nr:IS66 family transposase [Bradyrhizobium sp. 186]
MLAHVLVANYAWHLPLYRQAQILLAQGIDIALGSGILARLCGR